MPNTQSRRTSRTTITSDVLRPPPPPDPTECYEPDSANREAANMVNNVFCTLYCYAIVLSPAPILSEISPRPIRQDLGRETAHEIWNNCMYGLSMLIRALNSLHGVAGRLSPPDPKHYPDLGRISPIDPAPATSERSWMNYSLHISRWAREYQAHWDRLVSKVRPSTAFQSTIKDLLRALKKVGYDYPWMIETAESILKGSSLPPLPSPAEEVLPMTPPETPAGPERTRVRRGGAAPGPKKVRFQPLEPVVESGIIRRGTLGIEVEPWHSPPKVSQIPQWQQEASTDESDSGTSPQGPLPSELGSDDGVVYSVADDIAVILTAPSPEGLPPAELLRISLATRSSTISGSTTRRAKDHIEQTKGDGPANHRGIPRPQAHRPSLHAGEKPSRAQQCATASAWTAAELNDETYSFCSPSEYVSPKWVHDLPAPATTPRTLEAGPLPSSKVHGWSPLEQCANPEGSPPPLKYDTRPSTLPLRALGSCVCGPGCRCLCPRDWNEDAEPMSPASDVSDCGSDAPFVMTPPGTPRSKPVDMLYPNSRLGWGGDRFVHSAAEVFEY